MQADVEDAREDRERGGLRGGREERGDRRRRAFVDVGRPDVERHRGDLEAESRASSMMPNISASFVMRVDMAARDVEQVERAADAVDQRDAVQQDRRAHRAEDEVLHRRLGRLLSFLK